ncbi:MAG: hypothetical protein ACJAV6_000348 [Candidatus Paceibacteria bacterium]|jgi:hypothetical protein
MKHIIKTLALAVVMSPAFALAQGTGSGADFGTILTRFGGLLNQIIPIIILAGLAYFIFGVVRFVIAGDADKKSEARTIVIQGIIGLFVITSVWGLVFLFNRTFGVRSGGTITSGTPSICIPGTGDSRC